jgi:hypothetical protein
MLLNELANELATLGTLSDEQRAIRILIQELTDQAASKDDFEALQQLCDSLLMGSNNAVARIDHLSETLKGVENTISKINQPTNPFEFILETDPYGFADDSWEDIIQKGQALQSKYRDSSEQMWEHQGPSPWGEGGYGSFEAPKIVIKCVEPVYRFKNTARLPGSFQLTSHAHMGSVLRFLSIGDNLTDNNGWWHQTDAPVGIYIEPTTRVDGRRIRNFEQAISNVTIVGQNGTMPIYIADNAFNLRIKDCNIQAHQGASIVIKHGPALNADWYPVEQDPSGNNYLPDPIFSNCLIEGKHKWDRRNAGLCVSGNNIQFHGLNFYGTVTGIMSTGQGRTISACTMHHGGTHDGRTWVMKDQLALAIMKRKSGQNKDSLLNDGEFPIIVGDKGHKFTRDIGWYKEGEQII